MPYEIHDAATNQLLGAAESEAGALALVRAAILHQGAALTDALVLSFRDRDDDERDVADAPPAAGDAPLRRAGLAQADGAEGDGPTGRIIARGPALLAMTERDPPP